MTLNNILFVFVVPFLTGIIMMPILLAISRKTNFLVDVPERDALKIHTKSIPLLGGLAILFSLCVGVLFFWQQFGLQIIAVFIGLLIVFFLGFYDDLKWKHISTIKPMLKFALLLVCTFIPAFILAFAGIHFNFIPIYMISLLLGFAYIFISVNAVNYQDGMDGLAGGEVLISLAGFTFLGAMLGNSFAVTISLVSLGAVLAFLFFNFPLSFGALAKEGAAKVFMGDSGAYSLGFILTVLAILFSKPYNFYSILGPIFIIGLPIFDGVFTNIRRLANGKSIFLGDRSHFYDRLLQKGFSTKKTLAICYFLQIILVLIGVAIYK